MGIGGWYGRQKAVVQVAAVTGVLAVASGLVAGIFGIVDVELAKPGTEWPYALSTGDPFVVQLAHNVLQRFLA